MTSDCSRVAAYADAVLPLAGAALDDAYYYRSVSLCVIDAVYSIGVQYEGVQAVVRRYCDYFGLSRIRPNREVLPPKHLQESISTLCEHYDDLGLERMTAEVFCNRQRTSTRSGILKAEVVQRFALSLQCRGIEHLQDVSRFLPNESLERDIRAIPGQHSGISF